MGFVESLVEEWQVKPSVNPIDAIIGKDEE